jgi:hypothetical protein
VKAHVLEQVRRRFLLIVAAAISAIALGYGIGIAVAADPRLDEADAALQKARALLEASESGTVSNQAERRFEKAVGRGIVAIDAARQQIVEAKAAVDNP